MDLIFCTLFDSNYLDKGIVLYDSMTRIFDHFRLYIFAFDETVYKILSTENFPNIVVVPLADFETAELLDVKPERTQAEYCWTCTPWVIKYVLEKYNEPICTYIDADMMFFSSPQEVFDDMRARGSSIIIVPHRFKNEKEEKKASDTRGRYCVEFNTFINNLDGKNALNWWADRCLEWCFYSKPGTTQWYGDQKYLNVFESKFPGVYVCEHFGVGLAPWNIDQVEYVDNRSNGVWFRVQKNGEILPTVIYHYESVTFLSKRLINTHSRKTSKKMHSMIYDPYCERLIAMRRWLYDKYQFEFSMNRRVVTKNPVMKFYQRFLSPIRHIRRLSDLYWVNKEIPNHDNAK